jgi:hypothetical protein
MKKVFIILLILSVATCALAKTSKVKSKKTQKKPKVQAVATPAIPLMQPQPQPQPVARPQKTREPLGFGLQLGAGMEIGLGFACGGGLSYLIQGEDNSWFEIGGRFYITANSVNTQDRATGYHYTEDSLNMYYAVTAGMLFNYRQGRNCIYQYLSLGAGACTRNITWKSADDPAGSDTNSATTGVLMASPGVAASFSNGFEIRLQLPVFLRMTDGGNPVMAPMIIAGVGLRV